MITRIPTSASKKWQQWLYALVLSIVAIFYRALYLPRSDEKMRCKEEAKFKEFKELREFKERLL